MRSLRRGARFIPVAVVIGASSLVVGASGQPRAAAAPLLAPGGCGNVLLQPSQWLFGSGVSVLSNGTDEGTGNSCASGSNTMYGYTTGLRWQCPELINRLYVKLGWIAGTATGQSSPVWPGDGGSPFWNSTPHGLLKQLNGQVSYVGPGDIVDINETDNGQPVPGHVLIVNSLSNVTSGSFQVVSQNSGSPSSATPVKVATISNGTVTVLGSGGGYAYQTIGVIHAPSGPNAGADAAGNQYVVWEGLNGGLWEKNFTRSTSTWNSPTLVPAAITLGSEPAIAVHAGGGQDVFFRGHDGNLWEVFRHTGGSWSSLNLGDGPLGSQPSAGTDSNGNDYVAWRGTDGHLWYKIYSGGSWHSPSYLSLAGTIGSAPTVAVQGNNEVDVFWKGTNGNLYEAWYLSGTWHGTINLGDGPLGSSPSAGADQTGDQFVYWQGLGGQLWEKTFTASTHSWSSSQLISAAGVQGSPPGVAVQSGGEQDVFWKGQNGELYEYWVELNGHSGIVNLGDGPLG